MGTTQGKEDTAAGWSQGANSRTSMQAELIGELKDIISYHQVMLEIADEPYEVLRHMHYVDILEDIIIQLEHE